MNRLGMTVDANGIGMNISRAIDMSARELMAAQEGLLSKSYIPGRGYVPALPRRPHGSRPVSKADTSMSDGEARDIVRQYGLKGPLPSGLSREQRMKAYEGRYIAAGGPAAEQWDRHARRMEQVRVGAAGTTAATAFGAAISRGALKQRALTTATLGGIGAWGASDVAAHRARRKRASYSSSPAGVAGSALTRMQQYTPGR